MNPAIKLLIDAIAEIDEALSVPSYGDRVELDPDSAKKLLKRYQNLCSRGGLQNELVVKTHSHIQNDKEKKDAFDREDVMRGERDALRKELSEIVRVIKERAYRPGYEDLGGFVLSAEKLLG